MSRRRIERLDMLITWALRIGLILVMIAWYFIVGRLSSVIIFQFLLGFLIIEMPWRSIYKENEGSYASPSIDPAKDGQKLVSAKDLEPVVEACVKDLKPSGEVAEDPQPSDAAAEASQLYSIQNK